MMLVCKSLVLAADGLRKPWIVLKSTAETKPSVTSSILLVATATPERILEASTNRDFEITFAEFKKAACYEFARSDQGLFREAFNAVIPPKKSS